jgi:hypothetical protein
VRVIAERLGDEGSFARALLYNNVALPLRARESGSRPITAPSPAA